MAAPGRETRIPADEPVIAFTRLLGAPREFGAMESSSQHLDRLEAYLGEKQS